MDTNYAKKCSRWEKCAVNACPLSQTTYSHPKDPKRTCGEPLRRRLELAAEARAAGVNLTGMTAQEAKALEAGETMESLLAESDAKQASKEKRGQHAAKRRWGAVL